MVRRSAATSASRARAARSLPGQEALEGEAPGGQPAGDQRRDRRRRPGHHLDDVAGRDGGPHEPLARVGDAGHAGVGHHGDPLAPRRAARARRRWPRTSVWSFTTTSGRRSTPACWSRRPVRRVSSQQIASAAASASTARGDRSPRLPIGVPTSTSGTASVLPLELVAHLQAPAGEGARLRLEHRRAPGAPAGSGGGERAARSAAR